MKPYMFLEHFCFVFVSEFSYINVRMFTFNSSFLIRRFSFVVFSLSLISLFLVRLWLLIFEWQTWPKLYKWGGGVGKVCIKCTLRKIKHKELYPLIILQNHGPINKSFGKTSYTLYHGFWTYVHLWTDGSRRWVRLLTKRPNYPKETKTNRVWNFKCFS